MSKENLIEHLIQNGTLIGKILVSAAGEEIPQELINLLKIGGRMVIPVQNSVWKVDKISKSEVQKEEFPGFVFVPLK